jgi:hypothetical protein
VNITDFTVKAQWESEGDFVPYSQEEEKVLDLSLEETVLPLEFTMEFKVFGFIFSSIGWKLIVCI